MNSPRVSILMAVYNEAEYLDAALASLQRQTLHDWQLIVVDDGSDDGSSEILRRAACNDARIELLCPGRVGLIAALNLGLQQCRAPLLARMDGDDICHPRRLELQAAYLYSHPECSLLASQVRCFPRKQITDGMRAYEGWLNCHLTHDDILRDLFVESPFANPSVMLRTEELRRHGGYRNTDWAEDYDLWLRMAESNARFARLPETLLFWRDHPDRLTRTCPSCSSDAFRACKAHYLKRSFLGDSTEVTLWGAGLEGKAWRKTLRKVDVTVSRWIEIDPNKIGQTIHGAPVLSLESLAPGHQPMLITIGAKGARAQVRAFAEARGLREGVDYVCVT